MKHKFTYQNNRSYRCDNCGLFVDKDTMDDHFDQDCPNTGDLLSIIAKVDQLGDNQADLERRLLVLEQTPGETPLVQ